MNKNDIIKKLTDLGFKDEREGSYVSTTRLTHPSVKKSSVFVGVGSTVHFDGQTTQLGDGPFLIANGKGVKTAMTQTLLRLGIGPTAQISNTKDPYWQGKALIDLLDEMKKKPFGL